MSPAHRRYLRVETLVAAVINALLSIGFVYLVFGGRVEVPVGEVAFDALPQSFMVALMSSLVPTLLTRRRLAAGAITPRPSVLLLPRHPLVRAVLVAVSVALVAGAAHAVILPLTRASWSFTTLLVFKLVYGALLGAVVANLSVRAALAAVH